MHGMDRMLVAELDAEQLNILREAEDKMQREGKPLYLLALKQRPGAETKGDRVKGPRPEPPPLRY